MNDPWIDDEQVAAFLDGRLDERARAEMLSRLVADESSYLVFSSVAAILCQVETTSASGARTFEGEEDSAACESRGAPRGMRRGAIRHALALAAVLTGLMLVPASVLTVRASAGADPVLLASRLSETRELPAGWNEPSAWLPSR